MSRSGVVVAWEGLPVYGARLVAAGRQSVEDRSFRVIGTRPAVPLEGIEDHVGAKVTWIEREQTVQWAALGMPVPEIFIHTGWAYRHFNALGREVRKSGGKVVSMVDNRWKGNARQILGALYFRCRLRRNFAALWVPGESGARLASILGMPASRVVQGMYGADRKIFVPGPPLSARERKIVYVGQYVRRKGVDLLAEAWTGIANSHPDWSLECYGNGPLAGQLERVPGCRVFPFLQPEEIARVMRTARFLVLPSRDDHWGLVVHEAALSGCGLLVSDAVGAARDLVERANGEVFGSGATGPLERALVRAMGAGPDTLGEVERASLEASNRFGPDRWAMSLAKIISLCEGAA